MWAKHKCLWWMKWYSSWLVWCLTLVIRTVTIKSNSELILYPESAILIRSPGKRRTMTPYNILIAFNIISEHSSLEVETYDAMDNMDIRRAHPEEAHSCSEVRFRRIHLLHLYSCSSVSRYVTKNWSFSSRTNQIMQSVNSLLLLSRAFFVSAENIQNHILFRLPCSVGSSSGAWGKV